jgi:transposase InsO family protein
MSIKGRTRRGFTPEFKDEAVKQVINTGRPVARIEHRYNRRRRHASLGEVSPVAFEMQYHLFRLIPATCPDN